MIALASSAIALAAAQVPPPAMIAVDPPQQYLVRWTRSPVLCAAADGSMATAAMTQPVDPGRTLTWAGSTGLQRTLTLTFRIDDQGRPLSLRRESTGYVADAQDVMPAFAASRFAAGAARERCTVTFTDSRSPLSAAPVDDVRAYSVFPSATPTEAVWRRIRPAGATCYDPTPDVLLRAYPDFAKLPEQRGALAWSMVGFDIERNGKPVAVRTVTGSSQPALDAAARQAVQRSRFVAGARTGCLFPYFKAPATLPAPIPPEEEAVRPAGATCPSKHGWVRAPQLTYPGRYRRRSIEGWAMIAYDVAPWGETGNVRVLSAEPTGEFGDAAMAMIRNASLPPSQAGYIGCVDRVRYVMSKPGAPERIDPTPTPLPPPD
ncbi:TonB family protein [Sphingomonas sp. MA1305]|uniref:TonB family protein n=1 Tax=Sphingomonas sp. MA1305 TaxID=2479204 RepID=UPI001E654907|nr:TonB family protein [Sphingomonas sp. MA1305]